VHNVVRNRTSRARARPPFECIALLLQGGGALGAYQAGVYQALAEADLHPDWVAGISIGAINSAIIAGNPPEQRVAKLRAFWEGITANPLFDWTAAIDHLTPKGDVARSFFNQMSAAWALVGGATGFFSLRQPVPWLQPAGCLDATSFYETKLLKTTLEQLVDFDRINSGEMRFSVGAVNVRSGNLVRFDNATRTICPEHVMASGSLPPGFPPVEIDGECYWDGGLVSNTPLQYILDHSPRRSRLTFQVDVFQGRGQLPTNLQEVSEREKDIRYSSRTRITTENFRQKHEVRHAINELLDILPPDLRATVQAKRLYEFGCVTEMDIVQLIYRPYEPQGACKDYEFSRITMNTRWQQGLSDACTTLQAAPWLAPIPKEVGVRVFDVMHDILLGKPHAASQQPSPMEHPPAEHAPAEQKPPEHAPEQRKRA
jgi:NTE family protein